MKKLSLILALLLLIAMSLVSCGNPGSTPGTNPGGGGGTKPPSGGTAEKTVYQTLNERMSKEYSTIALDTVYKKGEMELCSEYRAVKSGGQYTVSYVEESFATFEEKNGAYVIPESYKTTASGSATVFFVRAGTSPISSFPQPMMTPSSASVQVTSYSDKSLK